MTEAEKQALIEKHRDAEWLALAINHSTSYMYKGGLWYVGPVHHMEVSAQGHPGWYKQCETAPEYYTFLIDNTKPQQSQPSREITNSQAWGYCLPEGYTQDAACLEAQARLLKRFPDGAVVAVNKTIPDYPYAVAVKGPSGLMGDSGRLAIDSFSDVDVYSRSTLHKGFSVQVFGPAKEEYTVGGDIVRLSEAEYKTLTTPTKLSPITAPEPMPTCKWHQKLVGSYANYAWREAAEYPGHEEVASSRIARAMGDALETAALKRIKHSLREWPTCPEGTVNVRWWSSGLRTMTNNMGASLQTARWECSCGRAGGVK